MAAEMPPAGIPRAKGRLPPALLAIGLVSIALLWPRVLGVPLLLLPGYLLSVVIWPKKNFWERLGLSFGFGLWITIWVGFLLARFFSLTTFSYTASVLGVSLALLPLAWGREEPRRYLSALRRREFPPGPPRLFILFLAVLGLSILPLILCFSHWEIPIATTDGGLFFALAQQMDSTGRFVENYVLSVPAQSPPVQTQALSLLALMLHRGLGVSLATACQIFPVLLLVALSVPLFLIGGRWGKFAALASTPLMAASRAVVVFSPAEFERRALELALSVWGIFLLLKVMESRSLRDSLGWGFLAGSALALFALSWPGWLYLVPIVVGATIAEFLVRLNFGTQPEKGGFHLAGVGILLATASLFAWGIGGISPRVYVDFVSMVVSHLRGRGWTRLVYQEAAPGSISQIFEFSYSKALWVPVGCCVAAGVLLVAIRALRRKPLPWQTAVALAVWFAVVMGMCWPGKGYIRFMFFLSPILALIASIPVGRLRGVVAPVFLCILVSLPAVTTICGAYSEVGSPPEWADSWEEAQEFFAACRWLRENSSPGSLVMADFKLGYLLEAFGGVRALSDPGSYGTTGLGEDTGPVPPFWIIPSFGGTPVSPDQLVPHPPTMGRAPDAVWAHYLDENELTQLLQLYENWGLKVDYLLLSFRRLGEPQQFLRVRTEDILGWGNVEFPVGGGVRAATIGGSQLEIRMRFSPSFRLDPRVDGRLPVALLYCDRRREDRTGVEMMYIVRPVAGDPGGSRVVLALPPEPRGDRLHLPVGLARVHGPPALQLVRDWEEVENFEVVYRGANLTLLKVKRY